MQTMVRQSQSIKGSKELHLHKKPKKKKELYPSLLMFKISLKMMNSSSWTLGFHFIIIIILSFVT